MTSLSRSNGYWLQASELVLAHMTHPLLTPSTIYIAWKLVLIRKHLTSFETLKKHFSQPRSHVIFKTKFLNCSITFSMTILIQSQTGYNLIETLRHATP